jgi:hypothetical protein
MASFRCKQKSIISRNVRCLEAARLLGEQIARCRNQGWTARTSLWHVERRRARGVEEFYVTSAALTGPLWTASLSGGI